MGALLESREEKGTSLAPAGTGSQGLPSLKPGPQVTRPGWCLYWLMSCLSYLSSSSFSFLFFWCCFPVLVSDLSCTLKLWGKLPHLLLHHRSHTAVLQKKKKKNTCCSWRNAPRLFEEEAGVHALGPEGSGHSTTTLWELESVAPPTPEITAGGSRESLSVLSMNVTTACPCLVGLECEFPVFCMTWLQLSCYSGTRWRISDHCIWCNRDATASWVWKILTLFCAVLLD